MGKTNTRTCRYANCPVENKEIIIGSDEYEVDGRKFYHKDCFMQMKKEKEKHDLIQVDMACILDLWQKYISNTVNYGYLRKILNECLERGISSDYMVFVMQYVVKHKMPLRYPPGFRYMLDREEIKSAYRKQQAAKILKQYQSGNPPNKTDAPEFTQNQQGDKGFEIIFNK